jgi:hypothetical protein
VEATTEAHFAKKFKASDSEEQEGQKEGQKEEGPDSESVPMELEAGGGEVQEGSAKASAGTEVAPFDFGEGMPATFRGQYEIMGVVTHKGRSADSGRCAVLCCAVLFCSLLICVAMLVCGAV